MAFFTPWRRSATGADNRGGGVEREKSRMTENSFLCNQISTKMCVGRQQRRRTIRNSTLWIVGLTLLCLTAADPTESDLLAKVLGAISFIPKFVSSGNNGLLLDFA
jgi:hypothetical protein